MLMMQAPDWRGAVAAPVWVVQTPPSEDATVWRPELHTFLAIPDADTSRDAELTAFALAAQAAIEAAAQITLFETVFTGKFPAFASQMPLIKRPFRQVTGITYVEPVTGEILTASTSLYHALETAQACGTVYLGDGLSWPDTARRAHAVEINVRCGFTAQTMPPAIVHALMMTVAALDANRGDCSCGDGGAASSVYAMKHGSAASVLPQAALALLAPWRLINLGGL